MLDVGRVAKSHGLRGEVVVELFTNREERLAKGAILQAPGGPLVVVSAKPHAHRWIVSFAGIDSREAADALHGVTLQAEPIDDPDALWVHDLLGAEMLDVSGDLISVVSGVIANPAGDLLETESGALVPLRFVVESGPGFVRVDPPAGLFDL